MTRKTGDKDHGIIEKNIIVSLINDYRLFNCSDREMLRLINLKTGKAISWTTFRKYKEKALKKDSIASEWLTTYCNSQIIDHYWKRIKELEYVQRILLEEFTDEATKEQGQRKNKYLINQLAKTIGELSTKLSEMGMSPPVIAKLYSMIPQEILNGNLSANTKDPVELEKYLKLFHDNIAQDREKAIPQLVDKENVSKNNESKDSREEIGDRDDNKVNPLSAETAVPPPIDQKTDYGSDGGTQDETATAQGDQPIF